MHVNRALKIVRVGGFSVQWSPGRPERFYFPRSPHLCFFDLGPVRVQYPRSFKKGN